MFHFRKYTLSKYLSVSEKLFGSWGRKTLSPGCGIPAKPCCIVSVLLQLRKKCFIRCHLFSAVYVYLFLCLCVSLYVCMKTVLYVFICLLLFVCVFCICLYICVHLLVLNLASCLEIVFYMLSFVFCCLCVSVSLSLCVFLLKTFYISSFPSCCLCTPIFYLSLLLRICISFNVFFYISFIYMYFLYVFSRCK